MPGTDALAVNDVSDVPSSLCSVVAFAFPHASTRSLHVAVTGRGGVKATAIACGSAVRSPARLLPLLPSTATRCCHRHRRRRWPQVPVLQLLHI